MSSDPFSPWKVTPTPRPCGFQPLALIDSHVIILLPGYSSVIICVSGNSQSSA